MNLDSVWTPQVGRYVALRETGSDRTVWADTFSGLYHVPPVPIWPETVLDLGANIGLTTAHYRTLWPDAQIVAVEMDAACCAIALAASGEHRHPNTYSGALAVTRALWDVIGGFDNRFVDWGWDDLAFWAACCAIGGDYHRIAGDAFHLWHPRSRAENEENPFHNQNEVLGRRYLAAKDDQDGMLAILREPGGRLATPDAIQS